MSEEMIVRLCSPTLAGLKTGSLFSSPYGDIRQLLHELRALNQKLVPKGLRVIPLRAVSGRALIYLYRPRRLKSDLANDEAAALLAGYGYPSDGGERCLGKLAQKLRSSEGFPHEIGLFLGYPPEDVRGFIENRAAHAKLTGCWKVYGDENKARQVFEQYKKCTSVYCAQWKRGKSIERLAVADR